MSLPRLLGPVLIFSVLVGCAHGADDSATSASSDLTDSITARVEAVAASVESRANGHVYVVVESYSEGESPKLGAAVVGDERRQAIEACAIYGGGLTKTSSNNDEIEDLDKYLGPDVRAELATSMLGAIGDAPIHRIDSFGVGDPGDDFSSRCTVAVKVGAGRLLMIQGHGHDSIL